MTFAISSLVFAAGDVASYIGLPPWPNSRTAIGLCFILFVGTVYRALYLEHKARIGAEQKDEGAELWLLYVPLGGMHRHQLKVENRSPDKDAYNVQIADAALGDGFARASFKLLPLLGRGQTDTPIVQVEGDNFSPEYGDDFDMIIFGAKKAWDQLPQDMFFRDVRGHDHVKFPLSLTFDDYKGKKYELDFLFDMALTFYQVEIQLSQRRVMR
ncbi:MAG: hypothetical protein HY010_21220 [Acidobacteria bacterium]|nr:hypothetical protein [Acidobacteriota bacterium]